MAPSSALPRYSTDLTDAQWQIVAPFVAHPPGRGRPRVIDTRQVVNAVLYVKRSGCQWRLLPHDFPDYRRVHYYFQAWERLGVWEQLSAQLREADRKRAGRAPTPSAGIVDSQSVRTTEAGGIRGFDGGKKVVGRKRHIIVDTAGNLLVLGCTAANIADRAGLLRLLAVFHERFPRVSLLWADAGYAGKAIIAEVARLTGIVLQIVDQPAGVRRFTPVPGRWVVERSFAWLGRNRRLSKDYEKYPESTEAFMWLSETTRLLNRLPT